MKSSETKEDNRNKGPFYFNNLIRQNERALIHLSNIRLKFIEYSQEPWNAKVGQMTKEYDACVKSIKEMADSFEGLLEAIDYDGPSKQVINSQIKEAEERGVNPVLKLEGIIEGIRSKIDEGGILDTLYETVEKLNITDSVDIDVKNVSTLHDIIRYIHQEAVARLFWTKTSLGFPVYRKNIGKNTYYCPKKELCTLKVIDIAANKQNYLEKLLAEESKYFGRLSRILKKLTSQLFVKMGKKENERQNLPVRAILEGYQELPTIEKRSHTVHVLASEDSVLCQIRLGYHFAKLESKINEDESFILLNYVDTGCSNASNRLFYVGLILNKLGYCVETKGKTISASLYNKSKKQNYGVLKETIRLLASSNDLDLCKPILKREYEAAYRFLKGEIEIKRKISIPIRKNQKKCKKFVLDYNYNWEDVEIVGGLIKASSKIMVFGSFIMVFKAYLNSLLPKRG